MDGQNWDPNAGQGQSDPNQPVVPGTPPGQGDSTPAGDTGGTPTWTPPATDNGGTEEPSTPVETPPAEAPAGDTGTDTGEEPAA